MIKKIYVDNFRCFVNFELGLCHKQLWLGSNGTGKSSVIDVLCKIQSVLDGNSLDSIFSIDDLTLWQTNNKQTIRLVTLVGEDQYEYELVIDWDRINRRCRIHREQLTWKGLMFYRYENQEAHLYRINRDTNEVEEGTQLGADWNRSLLSTIAERNDNWPLIKFRQSASKWLLVHPIPALVEEVAKGETRRLLPYAQNFAQWYRHAVQENIHIVFEATETLKQVLPGMYSLSLKESGEARRLTADFKLGGCDCNIGFGDLSDGQRQVIMLYVVLSSLKHSHSVLLIDEPDNFVCLREIEPWLQGIEDLCSKSVDRQAIIISHHPEVLNKMVDGTEVFFYRSEAGHILTKPYPLTKGLTAAETAARGWDDE